MPAAKPRLAFFSFTCCEGCQLTVLSLEAELPGILSLVDIVNFREAMDKKSGDYDIAFIEGSVTRPHEIEKLKKIRAQARFVVTLGACSSTGGLNCLKNRFPMEDVQRLVYGREFAAHNVAHTLPAAPVDSVIKVDHRIHGCPITKEEFLSVVKALLLGKTPENPNHPVCVDCKKAGNVCVFERGLTCMGPVTRAGCRAVCVTYGCVCWGCRGPVDDPNTNAHTETLKRYGLSADEVTRTFDLYNGYKIHPAKED